MRGCSYELCLLITTIQSKRLATATVVIQRWRCDGGASTYGEEQESTSKKGEKNQRKTEKKNKEEKKHRRDGSKGEKQGGWYEQLFSINWAGMLRGCY